MKTNQDFKKNETNYHKYAVEELAKWVNGVIEQEFYIDGKIVFIPDVTVYRDGILDSFFEVVYSHPLTGKKLGFIQEWCYRNATDVSLFEVSADYILKQTTKPDNISIMEYYEIIHL